MPVTWDGEEKPKGASRSVSMHTNDESRASAEEKKRKRRRPIACPTHVLQQDSHVLVVHGALFGRARGARRRGAPFRAATRGDHRADTVEGYLDTRALARSVGVVCHALASGDGEDGVVSRRSGRTDARGRRTRGGRGRRDHARASTRRGGHTGRVRSSASARLRVRRARADSLETRRHPQTRRSRSRRGLILAASHRPSRRASRKRQGSNDAARRGQVGRSVRGSEVVLRTYCFRLHEQNTFRARPAWFRRVFEIQPLLIAPRSGPNRSASRRPSRQALRTRRRSSRRGWRRAARARSHVRCGRRFLCCGRCA